MQMIILNFYLILNRVTQEVRIVSIFLINYQKSNNTDNVQYNIGNGKLPVVTFKFLRISVKDFIVY